MHMAHRGTGPLAASALYNDGYDVLFIGRVCTAVRNSQIPHFVLTCSTVHVQLHCSLNRRQKLMITEFLRRKAQWILHGSAPIIQPVNSRHQIYAAVCNDPLTQTQSCSTSFFMFTRNGMFSQALSA